MGYLTTITIYNDGCHQIKDHAEEFASKVYDACLGAYSCDIRGMNYFGIGNHCNLVTVQNPRHADNHTVYVHCGNTVIDMNPYDPRTKQIAENNPDYFKQLVGVLEFHLEELKKMAKEPGMPRN